MNDHLKGLLITGFGGLILTFDIPLLKLGGGDIWSATLTRSGFSLCVGLSIWLLARRFLPGTAPLLPGWSGVAVAATYGCSAVFFMSAVFLTSAANLVFILAFTSMFAGLLGWFIIGERPARVTLLAMAIMIGAIAMIVSEGLALGNPVGDLCAVAASFFLALAITLARRSRADFGFAPMMGGVIPIIVAAAVIASRSDAGAIAFQLDAPVWTILNGAVLVPLAFWCLATGPKYLPGPEVAMFYLLETVLAPVWVWMIFGETVTARTLLGGAIIIATLGAHSLWQLRRSRTVPHPVNLPV